MSYGFTFSGGGLMKEQIGGWGTSHAGQQFQPSLSGGTLYSWGQEGRYVPSSLGKIDS